MAPVNETISVLTQHNDNNRTGAQLQETLLNTSNVKPGQFGRLFKLPVDGSVYAQPLYVNALAIPNQGTRNVLYVATMHNTVYAFDGDDPSIRPYWQVSLGPSAPLPDTNIGPVTKQGQPDYRDISVEVGILSTPVISLTHNAIYVVAFTKKGNSYAYHLHALDLVTGQEKFGGPVQIKASVKGTGDSSQNGIVTFVSNRHNQRPGLLLVNENVYLAFASYGDARPYHGWLLGYSATTLRQVAVYNTTPNGREGGIWQAGQGPAADADEGGAIYVITGNGTFKPDTSALGDSIIKFRANLTILDWFSPFNNASLDAADEDLGSSGILLIPGTNLAVGGGKEGKLYVFARKHLGHFQAGSDSQILQSFYVNPRHHIHGSPIYWKGPKGSWIYVWPENDALKAYQLVGGKFQTTPVSVSTTTAPQNVPGGSLGMPGGMLSVSANGNTGGIIWSSHPYNADANQKVVDGILRAYDASDLTKEIWNSKINASHDDVGKFAKFCPPTVANGKIYLATFSGYVAVYGLLPSH